MSCNVPRRTSGWLGTLKVIFRGRTKPTIIQHIPQNPGNPFYTVIPEALHEQGWPCIIFDDHTKLKEMLRASRRKRIIIHFHQLEPYYHSATGDRDETTQRAALLLQDIIEFKQLGAILVWTKHNPLPHNRQFEDIDSTFIKDVVGLMDHIVVLGECAKKHMEQYVDSESISTVLHPSVFPYYRQFINPATIRSSIGLDIGSAFLFGSLGSIKRYKGHEVTIKAMNQLTEQIGEGKAQLLISGPADPTYLTELQALAGPDVILQDRFIPENELPNVLMQFDTAVFAFRDIWGSSSVVLALSFGVPVIAADIGCLSDYVTERKQGILFDHNNNAALLNAMLQMLRHGRDTDATNRTQAFNQKHAPELIARQLGTIYTNML